MESTVRYITEFLAGTDAASHVSYSKAPSSGRVSIIRSAFFDTGTYGTSATSPKTPFAMLPDSDIPFLFGEPRLEHTEDGRFVLYADLIASAYFLLSRYEEMIRPDCRDRYGRFLAKDSVIFQQGYGLRPLVDEWGRYLRGLLRKAGGFVPEEEQGLRKIWLTHDVDTPFKLYNPKSLIKQYVLNFLRPRQYVYAPLKVLVSGEGDPYFTFPKMIEYDRSLRERISVPVVSVYFIITARGLQYCSLRLKKFRTLITLLLDSGATLGLHVSHSGGIAPQRIKMEMNRLKKWIPEYKSVSRHHYLRWREPEHIRQMEEAGITDDFTLSFADSAGFRTGTCRPYKFINPGTKKLSSITIHPLQIMECTLDRPDYMGLDYQEALSICKRLTDETYRHGGELNILWHNTSFAYDSYQDSLYTAVLDYIARLSS